MHSIALRITFPMVCSNTSFVNSQNLPILTKVKANPCAFSQISAVYVAVFESLYFVFRLSNSIAQDKSCSELTREVGKLREEVSSLSIKFKWAQNKLKTETDGHKVTPHSTHPHSSHTLTPHTPSQDTKAALAASTKKLKESREEGEQIRADLKRMIHQYQESEEMQSNSLGLKLQKTQKELKAHEQEIADQQELHELTVKELDLTKASYKIAQQEVAQYKSKVEWLHLLV